MSAVCWVMEACPECGRTSGYAVTDGNRARTCLACVEHLRRLDGACRAMARFLAFVWCEAEARSDGRQALFSMHGAVAHDNRAFALGRAISLGLLRVEWPR